MYRIFLIFVLFVYFVITRLRGNKSKSTKQNKAQRHKTSDSRKPHHQPATVSDTIPNPQCSGDVGKHFRVVDWLIAAQCCAVKVAFGKRGPLPPLKTEGNSGDDSEDGDAYTFTVSR
ncbi:hypothetical protein GE21DRAFT_1279714 [Neurospora crassa]|nr:hypothetical protein GE21DRAFT_1279714 [Neurospora crassa]